jgi:ParB-like chromosome segregation protein Spo0J
MSDVTEVLVLAAALRDRIALLPTQERIEALNGARILLHQASPLMNEPIDLVLWIPAEQVEGNAYNPNQVAAPEMRLLEHSIREDGFTQPIVTHAENGTLRTIVDGFHRNCVGREVGDIRARLHGYLPVTTVNQNRTSISDRMASTIRHNRARGEHRVDLQASLVRAMIGHGLDDASICTALGMSDDEMLRLKQVVGAARMLAAVEYSRAWTDRNAQDLSDQPSV